MSAGHLISSDCPLVYLTITWGAAARTARVAMMVNKVNVIRQRRSRTWKEISRLAYCAGSENLQCRMKWSDLGKILGSDRATLNADFGLTLIKTNSIDRRRTMAANFQSPSMEADSSSSRILSVIT